MTNYNTFFTHAPSAVPICWNQGWDSRNKTHKYKLQDFNTSYLFKAYTLNDN